MLEAALGYARLGWPVFPCRPGEKAPATGHGCLDATTDPARITAWWRAAPDRNVAIATGAPGPDVLDVDVRPGGSGFAALGSLRRAGLAGGARLIVRTPSEGAHLYFRGTRQRNGHLAAHHVDFRAQGGYVLAPPSVVGGRPYVVVASRVGDEVLDRAQARELLDPPADQGQGRAAVARREADPGRLAAWVAAPPEGNRNQGLFGASMRLIESGRVAGLGDLARAAQAAGLSEAEAARTIRSARQHAAWPAGRPCALAPRQEPEAAP